MTWLHRSLLMSALCFSADAVGNSLMRSEALAPVSKPAPDKHCEGVCKQLLKLILHERASSNWKVYYDEVASFLKERKALKVVEVGTAWGGLAESLVKQVPMVEYNAVDPFVLYDPKDLQSQAYGALMQQFGLSQEQLSSYFAQAMAFNMSSIAEVSGSHYHLHHNTSLLAVPSFPDSSVDAIFVDGLHTNQGVRDDIKVWVPKIVSGGVMIFNDYGNEHFPGVKDAVDEFAASLPSGQKAIHQLGEPTHTNVYIVKP